MRDNVKGGALTEVSFYVLLSLYEPKHGYAIMQFIEEITNGRLDLGAGTLYGAINSMLEKNWIIQYDESNSRKKTYIITPEGKAVAENEITRLMRLVDTATNIMKGARL